METDTDGLVCQLARTVFDPGGNRIDSKAYEPTTKDQVIEFTELGEKMLKELVAIGNFSDGDLEMDLVNQDIRDVEEIGLEACLKKRTQALRIADLELVTEMGRGYEHLDILLDLLKHGMRSFVLDTFKPNGMSLKYRQSKSYTSWRALCNKHVFKLRQQGRAIIIPWEAVEPKLRARIHINTLILAQSSNPDGEGRCCLNASYSLRLSKQETMSSLNEGTDITASDRIYAPHNLPGLRDICDLAMAARARADLTGERVVGATVDVADAYRQFTLSFDAALHRTVMLYIGENSIPHLAVITVNNFGDTRAGHVYGIGGRFVDFCHEKAMGYKASATYVDDTVMLDAESQIEKSREECRKPIKAMFTEKGIKPPKDVFHGEQLVALGWHFDLRREVWRVAPKERGRIKMYAALFLLLPVQLEKAMRNKSVFNRTLHKVASIVTWYSAVFRVAKPFTHAIWKNVGYGNMHNEKVNLSQSCVRDLEFWRIIVLASMKDPHFFSSRIDQLATKPNADVSITTDASKLVGGGAWIQFEDGSTQECFIRWTEDELGVIKGTTSGFEAGISINVLEFFMVMYAILFWGDQLKGKTVEIFCDNTSAISWVMKLRGNNKSPVAEALVQLFTIYVMANEIAVVARHIKGIDNVQADMLSRLLSLQEKLNLEKGIEDTGEGPWWTGLAREEVCRKLLMVSITMPLRMPLSQLLDLVKGLR